MTTIQELKKWLNQFPKETIVEFAIQKEGSRYSDYGPIEFESPKLENVNVGDGWEFSDFRNNKFVNPDDEDFGKCYLRIGEAR